MNETSTTIKNQILLYLFNEMTPEECSNFEHMCIGNEELILEIENERKLLGFLTSALILDAH